MTTEEQMEELRSSVLSAASDAGIYDGDCPYSAIDCIRAELDGYSKLMWRIQRLCNANSAFPDDVFASIQKAVSTSTPIPSPVERWRIGPSYY